jgi:hypothetical protein
MLAFPIAAGRGRLLGVDSGRFVDGQKNHETAKRKLERAWQADGRSDRFSELLVATGVH